MHFVNLIPNFLSHFTWVRPRAQARTLRKITGVYDSEKVLILFRPFPRFADFDGSSSGSGPERNRSYPNYDKSTPKTGREPA